MMTKWIVVIGLLLAVLATTAVVPSSSDAWGCGGYYGGYYPGYYGHSYSPTSYGCGTCGWGGFGWGGFGRRGYGWGGYGWGSPGIRLGFGLGYGGWYY